MQDLNEKIIHISWKSPSQAGRANAYYHAHCYDAYPVALPDSEKREIEADTIAPGAECCACGLPLEASENRPAMTMSEAEASQLNILYSGVENSEYTGFDE